MKMSYYLFLLLLPSCLLGQQNDEKIFKNVQEMPKFPGCEDETRQLISDCSNQKLIEFIYKNLRYPEAARQNKIEGKVVIQFVVDKTGHIKDPKIVRDIGHDCGNAALDVVKSMSHLMTRDTIVTFDDVKYVETIQVIQRDLKWTPGFENGKPVNVMFTLPVNFKLQDEKAVPTETVKDKWITFPPEYSSYQDYKEQVLIPEQVALAFKVDPVESSKVVGDIVPYGNAMHPLLHVKGSHNGVDFRAVPGVAVMSTAEGIVELVETNHDRYGQYITVKHNGRTKSLYAHLSSISVKSGQAVTAGQQIGAVGMSGSASYPHLHYELHVNGQTENPILDSRDGKTMQANHNVKFNNDIDEKAKPLFVLDGAIQDVDYTVETLNPDDIESMHVLKGEAAKDKYGPLADHGVVEINLKQSVLQDQSANQIEISRQLQLSQNVPNPVVDYTQISFYLPNSRPASLLFYNQSGEFVYGIRDGFSQGLNEVRVATSDLKESGLLYYFLIQDQRTKVQKMIVVD